MTDIVPECDRLPFDFEAAKRGDSVCYANGVKTEVSYIENDSFFVFFDKRQNSNNKWGRNGKYIEGFDLCDDLRMIRQHPDKPTVTRYDPAKCTPFDREKAGAGEQVCNENGWPVTVLPYTLRGSTLKLAVIVHYENVDTCGSYYPHNLRMAPK